MNWTKLDSSMKNNVMDIMVDGILNKNSNFKRDLLIKLGVNENTNVNDIKIKTPVKSISKFGSTNFINIKLVNPQSKASDLIFLDIS